MKTSFRSVVAPVLVTLWLGFLAAGIVWPASFWMEVRSVRVSDAQQGAPIVMVADRVIHQPFRAEWSASVRDVASGAQQLACSETARNDYLPGAELPKVLTLRWWANGKCDTLPPGSYVLSTNWRIDAGWWHSAKEISSISNIFVIREPK